MSDGLVMATVTGSTAEIYFLENMTKRRPMLKIFFFRDNHGQNIVRIIHKNSRNSSPFPPLFHCWVSGTVDCYQH